MSAWHDTGSGTHVLYITNTNGRRRQGRAGVAIAFGDTTLLPAQQGGTWDGERHVTSLVSSRLPTPRVAQTKCSLHNRNALCTIEMLFAQRAG